MHFSANRLENPMRKLYPYRIIFLTLAPVATCLAAFPAGYPAKPVRVIVPFAAGAALTYWRAWSHKNSTKRWGKASLWTIEPAPEGPSARNRRRGPPLMVIRC